MGWYGHEESREERWKDHLQFYGFTTCPGCLLAEFEGGRVPESRVLFYSCLCTWTWAGGLAEQGPLISLPASDSRAPGGGVRAHGTAVSSITCKLLAKKNADALY